MFPLLSHLSTAIPGARALAGAPIVRGARGAIGVPRYVDDWRTCSALPGAQPLRVRGAGGEAPRRTATTHLRRALLPSGDLGCARRRRGSTRGARRRRFPWPCSIPDARHHRASPWCRRHQTARCRRSEPRLRPRIPRSSSRSPVESVASLSDLHRTSSTSGCRPAYGDPLDPVDGSHYMCQAGAGAHPRQLPLHLCSRWTPAGCASTRIASMTLEQSMPTQLKLVEKKLLPSF